MTKKLSQLFELERQGRYADALEVIRQCKATSHDNQPISALNLALFEKRLLRRSSTNSSGSAGKAPAHETSMQEIKDEKTTWSAIITMWKRVDYLAEQLCAIRKQSIPPAEIIIILNENHIEESAIRKIAGDDVKIIKSDINSLYSRWAIAYIAKGEYVSVFDDDVVPGSLWIANAIRASSKYRALVGPSGRIYSKNGKHDYYKLVAPASLWADEQTIDCGETDVYCDWVCNSYLLKREWVGHALGSLRYKDSFKTFDDIQLATSLFLHGGIQCITPMQPEKEKQLHGSLKHHYGNDAHAIWKTNSDNHFSSRRAYLEDLIADGYIPVQRRDNLYRIHLVIPFGERQYLERCLLSVKGQDYQNFTCTLVDDCHDGTDSVHLLRQLNLDDERFRYIKASKRLYPLRARELATDLLNANPADIIAHLDGDDWLPYPDVLSRLNRIYRTGRFLVTYGNAISIRNHTNKNFTEFATYESSKQWNVAQDEPTAPILPFGRIRAEDLLNGDWRSAPWCAMHMRTYQYSKWLGLKRSTFVNKSGEYLRVATDAAIFLPILNGTNFDSIAFLPELSYVYQNASNTIHAKKEITRQERLESLAVIKQATFESNLSNIKNALTGNWAAPSLEGAMVADVGTKKTQSTALVGSSINHETTSVDRKSAVVTIVTPNYLADAIICLKSYTNNLNSDCISFVFIASEFEEEVGACAAVLATLNIQLLSPQTLNQTNQYSGALADKYQTQSDEYRWAMKPVILLELLERGFDGALFLDPDTYTVGDITHAHRTMMRHSISVFPHFRDPDHEYLRKVLYKDGFFNGGMLAASSEGKNHLIRLYERCLNEMVKDPTRCRWDDQKYFDLFVLEASNLHVNLDRGIDYNPWNYEPVEGLVAPSQRSYLLKSGYFVRHWHVSTMMIKNSIEMTEKKFAVYRPLVGIYLLTLLYAITIIVGKLKTENVKVNDTFFGLTNRFDNIAEKLSRLSSKIPLNEFSNLLNISKKLDLANSGTYIETSIEILLRSILFDNFALFGDLISQVFNVDGAQRAAEKLRERDLRYVTDNILSSNELERKKIAELTNNLDYGQIISQRLASLRSYGIEY